MITSTAWKDKKYAVLGLARGASEGEIKKAYHRACLAVHPDKCEDARATQAFQAVQRAFDVLKDATTRNAYNANPRAAAAPLRSPPSSPPRSPSPSRRRPGPPPIAEEVARARLSGFQPGLLRPKTRTGNGRLSLRPASSGNIR